MLLFNIIFTIITLTIKLAIGIFVLIAGLINHGMASLPILVDVIEKQGESAKSSRSVRKMRSPRPCKC